MTRGNSPTLEDRFVASVGTEGLPIVGSEENGWTIWISGFYGGSYRYSSLDELMFALINLSVANDGNA